MLLEHERYHGLGTDALVTVCSWNTNVTVDFSALGMHALVTVCPLQPRTHAAKLGCYDEHVSPRLQHITSQVGKMPKVTPKTTLGTAKP